MNLRSAVAVLEKNVPNPKQGLPDDVFYYVSKITPLINVDLLIKDESGRTLLAWRDDKFSGKGWHVPGGIIRFKEKMETRIKKVSKTEIGVEVSFDPTPIAVNQFIHHERDIRSHFISLLFKCFLSSSFIPDNKKLSEKDAGYLKWHESCPKVMVKCHEIYRKYIYKAK